MKNEKQSSRNRMESLLSEEQLKVKNRWPTEKPNDLVKDRLIDRLPTVGDLMDLMDDGKQKTEYAKSKAVRNFLEIAEMEYSGEVSEVLTNALTFYMTYEDVVLRQSPSRDEIDKRYMVFQRITDCMRDLQKLEQQLKDARQ